MLMFFDSHLWTSLSEKVGQELSNYIVKLYQKFLMRLRYFFRVTVVLLSTSPRVMFRIRFMS